MGYNLGCKYVLTFFYISIILVELNGLVLTCMGGLILIV
jgi:hypothetical protein